MWKEILLIASVLVVCCQAILKGDDEVFGEHNRTVAIIGPDGKPSCTGGFFRIRGVLERSSNVLLTAAHCICKKDELKLDARKYTVEVNKYWLDDSEAETLEIKDMICHPDYKDTDRTSTASRQDVAIITVQKKDTDERTLFDLKKINAYEILRNIDNTKGSMDRCSSSGWGWAEVLKIAFEKKTWVAKKVQFPEKIQRIELNIEEQCFDTLIKFDSEGYKNILCVTAKKDGASLAMGDSGSHFTCNIGNNRYIIGLVRLAPNAKALKEGNLADGSVVNKVDTKIYDWIVREVKVLKSRNDKLA